MKLAVLFATLTLVQGMRLGNFKNGIDDESYDTHFDDLKTSIKSKHDS